MVHEALLQDLEDGPRFLVGGRLLHDGLVDIRVKGLAVGIDTGDAMAFEHFLQLVEETLAFGRHMLAVELGQFTKDFFLALGEVARRLDLDEDEQIARSSSPQAGHPLAGNAKMLTALNTAVERVLDDA